jgi:hypothetical protein
MVEKRKSPRIDSINLSYICLDKHNNVLQQAMGRTLDISEGGFLIETHFPIEKDCTIEASIGLGDNTIDIKGKIAHCQSSGDGKYITGVEITSIEDADKSLWGDFIDRMFGNDVSETDTDT